jgi:hypothetical protein
VRADFNVDDNVVVVVVVVAVRCKAFGVFVITKVCLGRVSRKDWKRDRGYTLHPLPLYCIYIASLKLPHKGKCTK